jgi:ubiquitin carboxyl-terminal hydrolase 4/11/15
MWLNDKDNKKYAVKITTKFLMLPEVIIIVLEKYGLTKKNVDFPVSNLDLSPYMAFHKSGDKMLYELYGVCNHFGSDGMGHYNSFIKVNKKWYCFDDEEVYEITERKVQTSNAYCLFYRKKK